MPQSAHHTDLLRGKQIAFTGRLASMTRSEAAKLVRAHGGRFVTTVSRRLSLLIIGQDGWPLQQDGRLTGKLRKARALQRSGYALTVLGEEELFHRLEITAQTERQLYSTARLSELVKVPGEHLRKWIKAGLIRPVENVNGVNLFDYKQVASARTLFDLIHAG